MSYRITMNGEPFCSSEFEHSAVLNPKVVLEVNKSGSLTFTMMPDHPFYNSIEFRQSLFDVYQNDELIFEGVPVSETTDFWNRKAVVCEGELTFLNDTIQRQAVYQNQTVQSLLSSYLSVHNAQADATKQFTVGSVTVNGGNTIYRYTNCQSTMQELQEDLIENFGGYFRIRHSGGVRYLDYLDSSPHNSSQTIRIGKNLVDFSRNLSSLDICTVLIPLGAKTGNQLIDGLDERLDIKSVNGNLDYLVGTAQAYYGNIWRTQVWDDVTTAAALKTKGQNYLDDVQWANLVISATAFDLGLATEDVEQFHVLDMIKVVSEPHGIDRYFMLTKLEMDLDHPASTKITLGKDERLSLSAKTAKAEVQIERQPTNILVSASESARQILDSATDGAIQFLYQNGVAYEMRINNSQDPSTATKWWRYNSGGWAYTDDGGQTYSVAATMDGTIFANLIKAGILSDENNIFSINFANGEAVLNKLTSTNAQITGGSIDIDSDSATQDKIKLKYGTGASYVASALFPQGIKIEDGTVRKLILNAGRVYCYRDSDDKFTVYLGNNSTNEYGILQLYDGINNRAEISQTGFRLNNSSGNQLVYLGYTTGGYGSLSLRDGSTARAILNDGGLYFYNSSGQQIAKYQPNHESGSESFSCNAGTYATVTVNFTRTFSRTPKVFAILYPSSASTQYGSMSVVVNTVSTTGCSFRIYNNGTTNASGSLYWITD